ncbi:MAG: hypothetical protein RIS06_561, partial [Actinomycetota bacterium]
LSLRPGPAKLPDWPGPVSRQPGAALDGAEP